MIIRQEYDEGHLTRSRPRYKVLPADKEPDDSDSWNFHDVVIGEAEFRPHTIIKPSVHLGEIAMHVVEKAECYDFDRSKLSDAEEDELIIEEQIHDRKQERRFGKYAEEGETQ